MYVTNYFNFSLKVEMNMYEVKQNYFENGHIKMGFWKYYLTTQHLLYKRKLLKGILFLIFYDFTIL